jgi:GNAT superfamily N-acetyltransferase
LIFRLDADEYGKISPIFKGLDYNLQIRLVIEGKTPGQVFVDDDSNPTTAFIWDESSKFFLAGHEGNGEFNTALNSLITEEIYPEAIRRKIWGFVLHFYPETWENKIETVLKNKRPMKDYRRYYTLNRVKVDWKKKIRPASSVVRVDDKFLSRTRLKNIDKVTSEIKKMWGSIDNFIMNGFGFCLLQGETIACWCLSEFNSGKRCEIGIETDEEHRKRGYATLTASAFLDHCVSNNISPGWHCWESNLSSIRLAEKIGFENPLKYPVYFDWFDEFSSLVVNGGWSLNRLKKFRESAEFYERAFSIRDGRMEHYYNAARAWALAGESASALRNLNQAVEKGWTDVERMEKDEDLKSLHNEKGWEELILRYYI